MKLSLNMWSSDILTKLFDQIEVFRGEKHVFVHQGAFSVYCNNKDECSQTLI